MSLRESSYRRYLKDHFHRQNGEGRCWPALLEASRRSMGDFSWNKDRLFEELKATKKYGADSSEVVAFLERLGISWYAESDCCQGRFRLLVDNLPREVDVFTSVWDCRFRPGYRRKDDRPEVHVVAPLEVVDIAGYPWVYFYDPDTEVGGVLPIPIGLWMMWWHEGPDSRVGINREVTKKEIDDPSVAFILVAGADREEVFQRVGKPARVAY